MFEPETKLADSLKKVISELSSKTKVSDQAVTQAIRLVLGKDNFEYDYFDGTENIFMYINAQNGADKTTSKWSKTDIGPIAGRWTQAIGDISACEILEKTKECYSGISMHEKGTDRYDIPLYQVLRLCAALLCVHGDAVPKDGDKVYALYSLDLSGIQKFIYTVTNKRALKGLRVRSLYLSLLMEYVIDEILDAVGMTRANVLYSGGGRAHLLLSSSEAVQKAVEGIVSRVNQFLCDEYDASLYLVEGHTSFSAESILNGQKNSNISGLSEVFLSTSRDISQKKLNRYSFEDIRSLNSHVIDKERECAICGLGRKLKEVGDDTFLCESCRRLEQFAQALKADTGSFMVSESDDDSSLVMPGYEKRLFIRPANTNDLSKAVRVYSINKALPGVKQNVVIHMSRFGLPKSNEAPYTFEDYAEASLGIKRIGVFRADVDNLGKLFASGFKQSTADPWAGYNLARYAALSEALTVFFQQNIDSILAKAESAFGNKVNDKLAVVYSGGDDVFLVGAWDEVLSAGMALSQAFGNYTGGKVTLSAGFGMYQTGLPVTVMAEKTGALEDAAKEHPGKNAIALFGRYYDNGKRYDYVHAWNEFTDNVIGAKYNRLTELFEKTEEKGNSFLYRLVELFEGIENDISATPRLAYYLAKHTANLDRDNADGDKDNSTFKSFVKDCYGWALDPKENKAFRTAALLYVYIHRNVEINGNRRER